MPSSWKLGVTFASPGDTGSWRQRSHSSVGPIALSRRWPAERRTAAAPIRFGRGSSLDLRLNLRVEVHQMRIDRRLVAAAATLFAFALSSSMFVPTVQAAPAKPDLGPNVYFFNASMPHSEIQ